MGKRKKAAKKPQGPKKREPLSTVFQCLFCNHENSVSIKMDKKAAVGHLSCKVCGVNFQHNINTLSQPVDVYYEWVDACDAVAENQTDAAGNRAADPYRDRDAQSKSRAAGARTGVEDFIDDDEADAEGDYADGG